MCAKLCCCFLSFFYCCCLCSSEVHVTPPPPMMKCVKDFISLEIVSYATQLPQNWAATAKFGFNFSQRQILKDPLVVEVYAMFKSNSNNMNATRKVKLRTCKQSPPTYPLIHKSLDFDYWRRKNTHTRSTAIENGQFVFLKRWKSGYKYYSFYSLPLCLTYQFL